MNHRIAIMGLFLAGCAQQTTGGVASSTGADELVLSMGRHSESPRGNLTVDPQGLWLYTSDDACKFVQGHFGSEKVAQIKQWLDDASLKTYVTQDGLNSCKDDQYKTTSKTHSMCLDADVSSEAGKQLIQLFHETSDKVMWDGVKRECMGSGPGTIKVSEGAKNTDPPPPPNTHGGAGSGTGTGTGN